MVYPIKDLRSLPLWTFWQKLSLHRNLQVNTDVMLEKVGSEVNSQKKLVCPIFTRSSNVSFRPPSRSHPFFCEVFAPDSLKLLYLNEVKCRGMRRRRRTESFGKNDVRWRGARCGNFHGDVN